MRHSVDTKLLQEILNYLATRPFAEVNGLISKMQQDAAPIAVPEAQSAPSSEEAAS